MVVDNPQVTITENDDGTFDASYQDAGRDYEIHYDSEFNKTGETVTKLYDDIFDLTGAAAAGFTAFDTAWNKIEDSLTSYTDGHTLTFASVNDNQLVVLGNASEVLLRVNLWSGEHNWTGWDGTVYNNKDYHYNIHDADWNHIGNSGSFERYVTVDSDGNTLAEPVLDESGEHFGLSSSDATVISTKLADYEASMSTHLGVAVADVTNIHEMTSEWRSHENIYRDPNDQYDGDNSRFELFGTVDGQDYQFLGSLEQRDGFIEIRDENWETVAKILSGDGKTVEQIEAEYSGFQAAWNALKDYMPSEFQPDVDESSLKFDIDDWGNIIVFDGAGAMIGRVHSWDYTNTWSRWEDGYDYTITNTSSGFNFNDADWNDIGRYETSDRDYTHRMEQRSLKALMTKPQPLHLTL